MLHGLQTMSMGNLIEMDKAFNLARADGIKRIATINNRH